MDVLGRAATSDTTFSINYPVYPGYPHGRFLPEGDERQLQLLGGNAAAAARAAASAR